MFSVVLVGAQVRWWAPQMYDPAQLSDPTAQIDSSSCLDLLFTSEPPTPTSRKVVTNYATENL